MSDLRYLVEPPDRAVVQRDLQSMRATIKRALSFTAAKGYALADLAVVVSHRANGKILAMALPRVLAMVEPKDMSQIDEDDRVAYRTMLATPTPPGYIRVIYVNDTHDWCSAALDMPLPINAHAIAN